jgi:hypothetical protein
VLEYWRHFPRNERFRQGQCLVKYRSDVLIIPKHIHYISGSQSDFSESQEIRDQFPGDPWLHFCNGYFEVKLRIILIKGIMFC